MGILATIKKQWLQIKYRIITNNNNVSNTNWTFFRIWRCWSVKIRISSYSVKRNPLVNYLRKWHLKFSKGFYFWENRQNVKCRLRVPAAIKFCPKFVRIQNTRKERRFNVWNLSLACKRGIQYTTQKPKNIAKRCTLTDHFESPKIGILSTLVNTWNKATLVAKIVSWYIEIWNNK